MKEYNQDILEALKKVFNAEKMFTYAEKHELTEHFYSVMVSGKIKEGADIYELLPDELTKFQDTDYSTLVEDLENEIERSSKKKGSVLQIGCGRGDLLMRMANRGFNPLFGIERSYNMLEGARKKVAQLSNVFLIQSLAEEYDYSKLENINTVIINLFWGMINREKSVKLLMPLPIRV